MTTRVVVADDQSLVRTGLVSLLDGAGDLTVVGVASDGTEALALVRSERPDVAVLDIRMPGLDGIEVVRRVRADPATGATRTVVLTTFGLDEYVIGALRAGADGFLVKDLEPDELVRAVQRVAAGDAVVSPAVTRALVEQLLAAPATPARPAPPLTPREADVLDGICRGHSNREIALALFIGDATVKTYVSRLLDKFSSTSRVGLVVAAVEAGLLPRAGRDP